MKAVLKGGPAHNRETDVDPTTRKIAVPKLMKGGFGQIIYSRTDRRQDGAVIFDCGEKLDTHGKS